jgi:hypothetical protein
VAHQDRAREVRTSVLLFLSQQLLRVAEPAHDAARPGYNALRAPLMFACAVFVCKEISCPAMQAGMLHGSGASEGVHRCCHTYIFLFVMVIQSLCV